MISQMSHGNEREEVHRLLATATAVLDSDQATARACIVRAKELLQLPAGAPGPAQSEQRGGLAPWQVRRLSAHIRAHLGDRIWICDLAELVGLSTSHFSRAFRQTFAVAPMRYVSIQRVLRAKELILEARSNLAEVALACGLCDQAHLSRVFRRVEGATPSFWRRQLSEEAERSSTPVAA